AARAERAHRDPRGRHDDRRLDAEGGREDPRGGLRDRGRRHARRSARGRSRGDRRGGPEARRPLHATRLHHGLRAAPKRSFTSGAFDDEGEEEEDDDEPDEPDEANSPAPSGASTLPLLGSAFGPPLAALDGGGGARRVVRGADATRGCAGGAEAAGA